MCSGQVTSLSREYLSDNTWTFVFVQPGYSSACLWKADLSGAEYGAVLAAAHPPLRYFRLMLFCWKLYLKPAIFLLRVPSIVQALVTTFGETSALWFHNPEKWGKGNPTQLKDRVKFLCETTVISTQIQVFDITQNKRTRDRRVFSMTLQRFPWEKQNQPEKLRSKMSMRHRSLALHFDGLLVGLGSFFYL